MIDKINTEYIFGEVIYLPFDFYVWKKKIYDKDKWFIEYLKKNNINIRKQVYLMRIFDEYIPIEMKIMNIDHK